MVTSFVSLISFLLPSLGLQIYIVFCFLEGEVDGRSYLPQLFMRSAFTPLEILSDFSFDFLFDAWIIFELGYLVSRV